MSFFAVGVAAVGFVGALAAAPPPKKLMIERWGAAEKLALAFGGMMIPPTLRIKRRQFFLNVVPYCSFDPKKIFIFSNKTDLAVTCGVLHSHGE
jgi:hypothetical protein